MTRQTYSRAFLALIFFLCGTVYGCGSSSGSFVSNPGQGSSTATIIVNNVLASPREIPTEVTSLRFTGKDSNGTVLYGPVVEVKQTTHTLTGVPIAVTSLCIDYLLDSGAVFGTVAVPVQLTAGGEFVVNDPNFADATPTATKLALGKTISTGYSGQTLASLRVVVLDQFGVRLAGAANEITISLQSGPGTLSGTTTRSAVDGVAVFDDLSLSQTGTYVFAVSTPSLPAIATRNITILDPGSAASPLAQAFNVIFGQTVPSEDGDEDEFPGQANYWDLGGAFELNDGGDDQFDDALTLWVGGVEYPSDQTFAGLTWLSPLFSAVDGVITAAVAGVEFRDPISDTYSAYGNAVAQGSICQTIDLTSAATPISLDWTDVIEEAVNDFGDQMPNYQVVIRDLSGNLLLTAYQNAGTSEPQTSRNADLSAFAGQQVQLCFEWSRPYTRLEFFQVDNVSVQDNNSTEFVTNGDFESGDFTGWTVSDVAQSQNVTTASRTVNGLDVTRTFYTRPDQFWGRWSDTYTNNGATPVTTTLTYVTDLGSDDGGIIYPTPGVEQFALSEWDGGASDRDVGFVHGKVDTRSFVSDPILDEDEGSEHLNWSYNVTLEPGESTTIVNFIVMNGVKTGDTATSINDRATAIDAICLQIANNPGAFFENMTSEAVNTVSNY